MASEWARKNAKRLMDSFICDDIAAALDEARAEGAERERWECYRIVCATNSEWTHAVRLIAARGAMRGPEEGE